MRIRNRAALALSIHLDEHSLAPRFGAVLSYSQDSALDGRGERIRTSDPLVPKIALRNFAGLG